MFVRQFIGLHAEFARSGMQRFHACVDLAQALGYARGAERIASTRYSGGLVTYSDVLAAQAVRLRLEDQVIETRGNLARDTSDLFKALGGGWPELASSGAQP